MENDNRYFDPNTTRNSQASTVDIRRDTLAESASKEDVEDENPWLADVVQTLNYSSPAVLVQVFDATPGEEHIAVYDRTEKRLAAGVLRQLTTRGFYPIYAGVKTLPYEVDGQRITEQHGWAEFRIHDFEIADRIQDRNDTARSPEETLAIARGDDE